MNTKYKNFILDVDGVFTDGKFHYTEKGKIMKIFGDGLVTAKFLKMEFHSFVIMVLLLQI